MIDPSCLPGQEDDPDSARSTRLDPSRQWAVHASEESSLTNRPNATSHHALSSGGGLLYKRSVAPRTTRVTTPAKITNDSDSAISDNPFDAIARLLVGDAVGNRRSQRLN
jgi:hypothetical protein